MRVAALGIPCPDPGTTWRTLLDLPPVDLLVLPELCFMPWLCAQPTVDADAWADAVAEQDLGRLPDRARQRRSARDPHQLKSSVETVVATPLTPAASILGAHEISTAS